MTKLTLILFFFYLTQGFKYFGWDGCTDTEVKREQVEVVGEAFYSIKMDKNNGLTYQQGKDFEYVIIPNNRHLYGWYYREVQALDQLDAGIIDIQISNADVHVPGTTYNFFGIENMMAIHQDNYWTPDEQKEAEAQQKKVLEEFQDKPYNATLESDFERQLLIYNHTLGVRMNYQFLVSLYDIAQVIMVKKKKNNPPDNTARREKLKGYKTNDIGNKGKFNKTSTNCLHIALEDDNYGNKIGKHYTRIALNQKYLAAKGETIFAPANVLQGVMAETYFTINQATQSLEIYLKYFAALQTDMDTHPLEATFFQGHPHTLVDGRINPVRREETLPYCALAEKYQKMRQDHRMLWRPREQVCDPETDYEFQRTPKPNWLMHDPRTRPHGEEWDNMVNYMAKFLPCSINYMQGWMHDSGGIDYLSASVWVHFVLEVPEKKAYYDAADRMWSQFNRVRMIYGNQDDDPTIVKGRDVGKGVCTDENPCGDGEGPCEYNSNCGIGLNCHSRQEGNDYILGYDLENLDPNMDICVNGVPDILVQKSKKHCGLLHKCGDGEGDCDFDHDCKDGMMCWQRTWGEYLGGYNTEHVGNMFDFCVPAKECPRTSMKPNGERCRCSDHLIEPDDDNQKRHGIFPHIPGHDVNDGYDQICGADEYCSTRGCVTSYPECELENWMNYKECICGDQICPENSGCQNGKCYQDLDLVLENEEDYAFTPVSMNTGIGGVNCLMNVAYLNGIQRKSIKVEDAVACQQECNKLLLCRVWDFEMESGKCVIRATKGIIKIAYGYVSGVRKGNCDGFVSAEADVGDDYDEIMEAVKDLDLDELLETSSSSEDDVAYATHSTNESGISTQHYFGMFVGGICLFALGQYYGMAKEKKQSYPTLLEHEI